MPIQETAPRRPIQETRIRDERRTSLAKTAELSEEKKLERDREIKIVHALQITRMELKRRGWDNQSFTMKESNPCSLKTLVDFACLNVFKEEDEEFIIRRERLLAVLNEMARKKSRKRKRSFAEWEQMSTMTEERICELLEDAITYCVKMFSA